MNKLFFLILSLVGSLAGAGGTRKPLYCPEIESKLTSLLVNPWSNSTAKIYSSPYSGINIANKIGIYYNREKKEWCSLNSVDLRKPTDNFPICYDTTNGIIPIELPNNPGNKDRIAQFTQDVDGKPILFLGTSRENVKQLDPSKKVLKITIESHSVKTEFLSEVNGKPILTKTFDSQDLLKQSNCSFQPQDLQHDDAHGTNTIQ